MSAATVVASSGAHPRASRIVPTFVAVFVGTLSLTLLIVGADSPYTHGNLLPRYDAGYDRTEQIVVGAPVPYAGVGTPSASGEGIAAGERLFVTEGCVTCHGIGARGSVVGPAIEHNDLATLRQYTHAGPRGMPRFSDALTDDRLAAISAYLRSLKAAPAQ